MMENQMRWDGDAHADLRSLESPHGITPQLTALQRTALLNPAESISYRPLSSGMFLCRGLTLNDSQL